MRTPAGEQRDHSGQAKFRRKQTPTLKQALEKEGAIYASKIITGPLDGSCASWWSFIRPEDRCLLMSTDKATNTLHRESTDYRDAVKRKINAYHVFIHAGVVSQRLLQYLAANVPKLVWTSFGSWLRTIGPGIAPL